MRSGFLSNRVCGANWDPNACRPSFFRIQKENGAINSSMGVETAYFSGVSKMRIKISLCLRSVLEAYWLVSVHCRIYVVNGAGPRPKLQSDTSMVT